jgi:HD-GYP domain-containing protein (c-di-GMP phosphodiesterase class II)
MICTQGVILKMLIPLEILNKKESLTDDEYEVIKEHPVLGSNALNGSDSLKQLVWIKLLTSILFRQELM